MCRMIGAICEKEIEPREVLVDGDNAFTYQSLEHPDGWGLVYYKDKLPLVKKSIVPAIIDLKFRSACFDSKSKLFIGHIRRATTGSVELSNNHPFVFENWSFGHNGQISNFLDKLSLIHI